MQDRISLCRIEFDDNAKEVEAQAEDKNQYTVTLEGLSTEKLITTAFMPVPDTAK